jgi:hypothetical protein
VFLEPDSILRNMNFGSGTQGFSPEGEASSRKKTEEEKRMHEAREKMEKNQAEARKRFNDRHREEQARFYANNPGHYNPAEGADDFIQQMNAQMNQTFEQASAFNKKIFGEEAFTMPNPNETFQAFKERMKTEAGAQGRKGPTGHTNRNNQEKRQENSQSEVDPQGQENEAEALKELGLTEGEREAIFRINFPISNDQIVNLAEKIFKIADGKDKDSVKRAFQRLASELHPDKQNTGQISEKQKKINEVKYSLISTFYNNKYKKHSF